MTQEETKEDAPSALTVCPKCRLDLTKHYDVKPSEEELKEYVRCLLGGRLFSKSYSLFEGQLSVKFSLLSNPESNAMSKALDLVKGDDQVKSITDAIKIKTMYYCREFNSVEFHVPKDPLNWEEEYNERFSKYGEDVPVIISRVLMEFLRLSELLPISGMDSSFYRGAGLA